MFKKLKECKTIKEIYQVIPESFYEKSSFVLIIAMMMVIVVEAVTRIATRHESFAEMTRNFYIVGYMLIAFSVIFIGSRICKMTKNNIIEYFKHNIYELFFIIMLAWIFISALMAENKEYAFLGSYFRQNGYRTYLIYASIYICGKNIRKMNLKRIIFWTFGSVASFQNLLILSKYLGYYGSNVGAFYNSNHSGYFIMMAIFALSGLIITGKKVLERIIAVLLYSFNIWCLIINNTFGCYLAVIMGILFLITISFIKYRKILISVICITILFIGISIFTDMKTDIVSNNFGITGNDINKISSNAEDMGRAGSGRWKLWIEAVGCIKDNPIFGCGPENIVHVVKSSSEPHNEFLQMAAEYGIPSVILYILALIFMMINKIKTLRKNDDYINSSGSIIFAYLVSSFFGVMLFYTTVFYYLFLGMLSSNNETRQNIT